MSKRSTEIWYENAIYALLLVGFSILLNTAFLTKTKSNVNGMKSMTFPKAVMIIMIVLCTAKLMMNIVYMLKHKEDLSFQGIHSVMLISLGAIIVYVALWNVIGFGLSSVLFVALESKLLRNSARWWKCITVGVGTTVVLYILFGVVFKVDFMEPIFELLL